MRMRTHLVETKRSHSLVILACVLSVGFLLGFAMGYFHPRSTSMQENSLLDTSNISLLQNHNPTRESGDEIATSQKGQQSVSGNPRPTHYSAITEFPLTESDVIDPDRFAHDFEGTLKFMMSFKETVYCRTEERLGRVGDGGKWVCHPRVLLRQPKCVVYSLGSNGDFTFELAIHQVAPNCDIHTFDPTPGIRVPAHLPPKIKFHRMGVAANGIDSITLKGKNVPVQTLAKIMDELGHESLALLKVDIEGSEYGQGFFEVVDDSGWRRIAQLDIEVHCYNSQRYHDTAQIFANLSKLGLELFHREVNPYQKGLFEYAFLNPKLVSALTSIPYTPEMLEAAEAESQAQIEPFRTPEQLRYWMEKTPKTFFFIDEPHYFNCTRLEPLPGDNFHRFCSSHFQDPQTKDKQPMVLVFTDKNSDPLSYQWLPGLYKALPSTTKFHIWKRESTFPPAIPEMDIHFRYSIHDLASVTVNASPKIINFDKVFEVLVLSKDSWLALIIFEIGTGFENLDSLLTKMKSSQIPTFPPIQVLVDVSFCKHDYEGQNLAFISRVLDDLGKAGFKMVSKDLQVHRYYKFPAECHYIFLYST